MAGGRGKVPRTYRPRRPCGRRGSNTAVFCPRGGQTNRGVIELTYQDLYALFEREPAAKRYFDALPGYVQDHICTRAGSVNSLESLRDYAENLTRGDG